MTKGTEPPEYKGRSNADRELEMCLHEYYVANIISKYGEARLEDAKKRLTSLTGTLLAEVAPGDKQTIAPVNGNYAATITGRMGALRLNKDLLTKQMIAKYKMSVDAAEEFCERVSKRNRPSILIDVTELKSAA